MTDIAFATASAETSILEIARQASALAVGLQNAAPGDKVNSPNKSIQYLFDSAEHLSELAKQCKKLLAHESKEQGEKLLEVANDAVQYDKELREKYQIGDKFRFIRDRLNAMLENVKEAVNAMKKDSKEHTSTLGEDEMLVYIYLFNAQGIVLQTWNKMVNPAVFYDHSINRPIYIEKSHIEMFINRKANKTQHGYLTVIVKKQDVFKGEGEVKDAYENPLVKVREGSLHFHKLVSFTHNGHEFIVNDDGGLEKKS